MVTSGHSSPIWAYRANAHKMRASHDEDRSNPKDMCSLGVVDLDISLSPDAFGLQAFDHKKPLTRMLPGSSRCELQLMLPDSKLGTDGFHDVLIDNLAAFRVIFRRRMSQPCADGGRRLCSVRCSDGRRKWSASAEVLIIDHTRHFDTVRQGFAPYVK